MIRFHKNISRGHFKSAGTRSLEELLEGRRRRSRTRGRCDAVEGRVAGDAFEQTELG